MSYRTKPGPESCRARPWGRGSVRHDRVATLGLVRDKFGIMWMISVHTSKNNKIVMANTASQTLETRPGTKTSAGRVIAAIARVLLGLLFLVFGLNGFLNFMPVPKDLPPDVITVSTGLMKGGYLAVVSATEIIVAVLLLTNRFVPLALALLAPIVVGILTFHIAIAPATIIPGTVVLVIELYLAWAYRGAFRPMLRPKVSPGPN
jgi:uncharacterized membrane protein YphA (DoxX/SURF4 family)